MTAEKQFGTALYELAREENRQDEVLNGINAVLDTFKENPQYLKLLSNPAIPKGERVALIEKAFGENIVRHAISFIKILCEKGQLNSLSACAKVFTQLLYSEKGILPVTVTSAVALSKEQQQRLEKKLSDTTGKTIQLALKQDESLIAGISLSYDGKLLDGSIKQRLDKMKAALLA